MVKENQDLGQRSMARIALAQSLLIIFSLLFFVNGTSVAHCQPQLAVLSAHHRQAGQAKITGSVVWLATYKEAAQRLDQTLFGPSPTLSLAKQLRRTGATEGRGRENSSGSRGRQSCGAVDSFYSFV